MKRTTAREIAVQLGFYAAAAEKPVTDIIDEFFDKDYYATLADIDELYAEYPEKKQMDYIIRLASLVEDYRIQIDNYINKYSNDWKIGRISKTAVAVMRCAICEVLYMDDIPNATAINEAIELAKGYDDPETVSFINGVLGGFMRGELGDEPAAEAEKEE